MGHPAPRTEGDGPKRRACDECRSRKLACTKENDGCSRCKRDGVACNYSRQKPMGRPRKSVPSQDIEAKVRDQDVPQTLPFILPASDSAMDLDLDLAFFDMNEVSFLDLMGSDLGMNTTNQTLPQPPKSPVPQARWQMLLAEHLSRDIDFNEPQPQPLSEDIHLDQAASIMAADPLDVVSLPGLSPEQPPSDHSTSDRQPDTCSCLASLYLALDSLTHLPTSALPAIATARTASKTAYTTITCPVCSNPPIDSAPDSPNPPIQSLQNLMMLGALLPSISSAYKTILRLLDTEAESATLSSTPLVFDLSSIGGLWGVLAEPRSLCGATENVDGQVMDPTMWRLAVRALLKIDVYGLGQCAVESVGRRDREGEGPGWQLGLKDIIRMMEERSRARHEEMDRMIREGRVVVHEGGCEYIPLDGNGRGERPTCLRIIEIARRSLMGLNIL